MSTTLTPPPVIPGSPAPPQQNPTGARAVAIVVIVLGALVLIGAATSAVLATVASASVHTSTRTLDVAGVEELDIDTAAGTLRVEFADVSDAELEVTSSWGADNWRFVRDGDELKVASPDRRGWLGWLGWVGDDGADAVLRLPSSLEGLDADVSLAAGEFSTDGDFGELDLSLAAGSLDVSGTADSLSVDVSAGRGTLEVDGVREAELTVSAGTLDAVLTGARPDSIEADVSAGTLRMTVPEGDYDVTSEVSAGAFDNRIGSVPGASSTVRVEVSAGEAVLKSGR